MANSMKERRETDAELLARLEAAILKGVILWDGHGAFPCESVGSSRCGISLLGGSRSIREAIRRGTVPIKNKTLADL